MKDDITIIIPAKNEERYIYNTLKSISNQIGIDGINVVISLSLKTTDNTRYEIERAIIDFPNINIRIIIGGTVSEGRNNGVYVSKTPYLLFMDADTILMESDIISKTLELSNVYKLITVKQISTEPTFRSYLIWHIFNIIRIYMRDSFSTGCYFFISKQLFESLGGFNEDVTNSEDYLLSRMIPKSDFKILDRYIGQDNRRFEKMGYFGFLKLIVMNYLNRNDIEYFKKDVGYW